MAVSSLVDVSTYIFLTLPCPANKWPTARPFGIALTGPSQRHWHTAEDEFVWVLEGEVTLIDDAGEHTLRPGDCAAFAKGVGNGHHLVNRSDAVAKVLEVGSRKPHEDGATYPDIDMRIGPGRDIGYTHKDGTPYSCDRP